MLNPFLTEEKKSFQIKRNIEYHKSDEIFDDKKNGIRLN